MPSRQFFIRRRERTWHLSPVVAFYCLSPRRRILFTRRSVSLWCIVVRNTYYEHKEFCLHTDNQSLAWLLQYAKKLGRIGRWVLRLAHFKFKIDHISGKTTVVAGCLARQYEDLLSEATFPGLVLQHLSETFQSIKKHQRKDHFCKDLYQNVIRIDPILKNFEPYNGTLVCHPSWANMKRYPE
jgi:hypothetical protein